MEIYDFHPGDRPSNKAGSQPATSDVSPVEESLPMVLIVDDDVVLRSAIVRTLTKQGFRCVEASNGLEAKDLVNSLSDRLGMVVSDVRMPGLSGFELLKHIRGSSKMPVLLISGFTGRFEEDLDPTIEANGFLKKPFRMAQLVEFVRQHLTAPEPKGS